MWVGHGSGQALRRILGWRLALILGGAWRLGNLYRQNNVDGSGGRRDGCRIHAHDLAWHRNQLVVAGNVPDAVNTGPKHHRHGAALARSSDEGKTWSVHRLQGWRATAMLAVDD